MTVYFIFVQHIEQDWGLEMCFIRNKFIIIIIIIIITDTKIFPTSPVQLTAEAEQKLNPTPQSITLPKGQM